MTRRRAAALGVCGGAREGGENAEDAEKKE